jgi:hypothetical protein
MSAVIDVNSTQSVFLGYCIYVYAVTPADSNAFKHVSYRLTGESVLYLEHERSSCCLVAAAVDYTYTNVHVALVQLVCVHMLPLPLLVLLAATAYTIYS